MVAVIGAFALFFLKLPYTLWVGGLSQAKREFKFTCRVIYKVRRPLLTEIIFMGAARLFLLS